MSVDTEEELAKALMTALRSAEATGRAQGRIEVGTPLRQSLQRIEDLATDLPVGTIYEARQQLAKIAAECKAALST